MHRSSIAVMGPITFAFLFSTTTGCLHRTSDQDGSVQHLATRDQELGPPPVSVLALLDERFSELEPTSDRSKVLEMLGLGAYETYFTYTQREQGGAGLRGIESTYLSDHHGYSLKIHQNLDGELTCKLKTPKNDGWRIRDLSR